MFRRLFWISVGAGAGTWATLKAQRLAARFTPGGAADGVKRAGGRVVDDLRAARRAGTEAKRAVEAERGPASRAAAIDVAARATASAPGTVRPRP